MEYTDSAPNIDGSFAQPEASDRLRAVMAAGIAADPAALDALVRRCAVEPDFQVREMLTWAIIRLPREQVVPRVVAELASREAQARCQALHTLSKLRDAGSWVDVAACLDDQDRGVVRTAWYAAVAVVPDEKRDWLARRLARELGMGPLETQRSLSRALLSLGSEVVAPVLSEVVDHGNPAARAHAEATSRLFNDPDAAFTLSVVTARREVALGRTRSAKG